MFSFNSGNYFCIGDYHNKFLVIKRIEILLAAILILLCENFFAEYSLPKKTMSDAGGNLVSDNFAKT